MKYFDIMTKRTYEKNGEQKNSWLKAGTLRVTDEGKQFIELNHLPDVTFFVFEPKPRDNQPKQEANTNDPANIDIGWDE